LFMIMGSNERCKHHRGYYPLELSLRMSSAGRDYICESDRKEAGEYAFLSYKIAQWEWSSSSSTRHSHLTFVPDYVFTSSHFQGPPSPVSHPSLTSRKPSGPLAPALAECRNTCLPSSTWGELSFGGHPRPNLLWV
jgi:hypothetical protein